MDAIAVLRNSAEFAYMQLQEAISDVDEPRSWATVTPIGDEYLNTVGNIVSIVQHIAGGKVMYASCAFTNMRVRGRETFEKTKHIGTDWEKTKAFLQESHDYWMESWSTLRSDELEDMKGTHRKDRLWPAWQIIAQVIVHDEYHAGQINLIRSTAEPTTTPPDMRFDEEEKYARETVFW
jgi:hypothetical protein